MAGRKPTRVYVYNEEGEYICMFENMQEFRDVYYPSDIGKRPLFNHEEFGVEYHYMEDLNLIAIHDRSNAGRDLLRRIIAVHNSEYCKKKDNHPDEKIVQVLNLKEEVIAEFKTQRLLLKLMPYVSEATLSRQLNLSTHKKKFNKNGLFFRYKEEKENK